MPCRQAALKDGNGRCHMHGGRRPIGAAAAAFRHGKRTKQATLERKAAKSIRRSAAMKLAEAQLVIHRRPEEAREKVREANELQNEAFELETAWLKRHHPEDYQRLMRKKRKLEKENV